MSRGVQFLGFAQIAIAMTIVGSSVVVGKVLVTHLPIFLILGLRFGIACMILIPLAMRADDSLSSLRIRDVALLIGQALSGVVVFGLLMLVALKYTNVASAGIITGTLPIMTGLLATMVLSEKMTMRKTSAMLLSTLSVAAVVGFSYGGPSTASSSIIGDMIALVAVFGEAVFAILSKMTR